MRLPVDHLKVRNEPKSVAQPRPAECLGWVDYSPSRKLSSLSAGLKRPALAADGAVFPRARSLITMSACR